MDNENQHNAPNVLAGVKTDARDLSDPTPVPPSAGSQSLPNPEQVVIYAKAAAGGARSTSGFSVILCKVDAEGTHLRAPKLITGRKAGTTAPQMEMLGVVQALEALKQSRELPVILRPGLEIIVNGINRDMETWRLAGWKKSDGKDPANLIIWQALAALLSGRCVKAELAGSNHWADFAASAALAARDRARAEWVNG